MTTENIEKLEKTLNDIQNYMEGRISTVSYKGGYIDVKADDFTLFKELIPFYLKTLSAKEELNEADEEKLFPFYKVMLVLPTEMIADFISAFPNENIATFIKSFMDTLAEHKAEEKLNQAIQGELFPLLKLQKNVEIKKDFALNFGGLERIERDFKHLLSVKLSSGKTLQQHIDKVKEWFNSLYGENMGNWIKLFAFVKAVGTNESAKLYEVRSGYYKFSIKQDKNFFQFFIRRDKKSGQFTTKAKNKILKWLYDNQSTIEFPMIINNEVWNMPIRVYEYAENVSTKEIFFIVNTNILESEFKDYVSIEIDEIDMINDFWGKTAAQNNDFAKYRLNDFMDIPLKFLLTLKQIYSAGGNFTTKSGYQGNVQKITGENLNGHLGNLSDRVRKHLQRINAAGERSRIAKNTINLLLNTTWEIALKRKWLMSKPKFDDTWIFNINPGYFAKKTTAIKLKP